MEKVWNKIGTNSTEAANEATGKQKGDINKQEISKHWFNQEI